MKGFDVLKVKSAVKSHNKFDLSRSHLTTMDFGQIVPLFVEETVPGDKISVKAGFFSRMAPLAKPTYGKFYFKTVSAFVPYHQIAWDCDAWMAGKTSFEGITPHTRTISMDTLSSFYRNYCLDGNATATAANCDISWIDASNNPQYGVFSNEGRYFNKVLNSLGYCFPQNTNLKSGSDWMTRIKSIKVSALPLLAFAKLYNDYMSQSQRFNSSALSYLLQNVKYGKNVTNQYTSATGAIQELGVYTLLQNIKLNYENDYFTSAWQSPNNPLALTESLSSMDVPYSSGNNTSTADSILADINNNLLQTKVDSNSIAGISQRALDFLKSFDDWVRRNNYSGSRAVQQVYSRFGIKTDDYKSHYANVIKTDTMPVQVGDITATAEEPGPSVPTVHSTNILGSYAGKGIMNGDTGVSCSFSDYGLFMILGYFTVAPMNSYGFDRRVLRSTPLDYYNPEFDGLGADAIPVMEYYENPLGAATSDSTASDAVFGFTERYNAYRYGRDVISGDFRKYRNADDWNCWHTGRNLADARKNTTLVAQSSTVNTLSRTDSEYNRIFSITSGAVDHFFLTAQFNVDAVRPMLNLNQVPNLGQGDTVVPRNGNVIS